MKEKCVTFRAGPEEQIILAHLGQQLGCAQSEIVRRLIRAAKVVRPVRPGRVKIDRQAIAQGEKKNHALPTSESVVSQG